VNLRAGHSASGRPLGQSDRGWGLVVSADEDQDSGVALNNSASELNVGTRVRVYPGSDNEKTGEIVDDFGQDAGTSVTIGNAHIAAASRRWAVALDGGGLVFVDSGDLSPQ
jgi:hypothetical protein